MVPKPVRGIVEQAAALVRPNVDPARAAAPDAMIQGLLLVSLAEEDIVVSNKQSNTRLMTTEWRKLYARERYRFEQPFFSFFRCIGTRRRCMKIKSLW